MYKSISYSPGSGSSGLGQHSVLSTEPLMGVIVNTRYEYFVNNNNKVLSSKLLSF
jgi:hypothetical protein